ncbi:hypothetical protein PVMG_02267 [Plasmodium vivax Mauritania I]|uniref:VIR protein n=1 Tax=Plasmodium vivax Mauritania I TaxID=1035515 RepID=A0A0J9TG24_PLAVI|nr:hypothetical protein PVMG_02267 [Plasmodium vivax Mauritania I]
MDISSLDLNDYNEKCNKIYVREHKAQMILICEKYLRFLDKSKEWSRFFSVYDVSLLLNYWLYDKVTHIYGTTRNDLIDFAFAALQMIWDRFDSNRREESYYINCKPDHSKVKHEDWKNRKKLYDYYVDFDTLFGTSSMYDNKCKEYYENFKEMISIYKYFDGKCSHGENNCPEFFYKFKNKNPLSKLEKLSCYTEMDQQKTAAAEVRPSRSGDSLHSLVPKPGLSSHEVDGGLQDSAGSTQDRQLSLETSGIGKKVTHSVLGAAPVLLTATALYRYTPLGPWIRKLRAGSTNNMNAMDGFSPYTQENGDMFSNDTANYISYQPI